MLNENAKIAQKIQSFLLPVQPYKIPDPFKGGSYVSLCYKFDPSQKRELNSYFSSLIENAAKARALQSLYMHEISEAKRLGYDNDRSFGREIERLRNAYYLTVYKYC